MNSITSDDILGKIALDSNARVLGVIVKLHIDPEKKEMLGITIDQGITKPDLFVGLDLIKKFGKEAIFLKGFPYNSIKGREVIKENGEHIGTVEEVKHENDIIRSIIVSKKIKAFNYERLEFKASKIKEIGETIIIKN